jgi:hypothetical protein
MGKAIPRVLIVASAILMLLGPLLPAFSFAGEAAVLQDAIAGRVTELRNAMFPAKSILAPFGVSGFSKALYSLRSSLILLGHGACIHLAA